MVRFVNVDLVPAYGYVELVRHRSAPNVKIMYASILFTHLIPSIAFILLLEYKLRISVCHICGVTPSVLGWELVFMSVRGLQTVCPNQ